MLLSHFHGDHSDEVAQRELDVDPGGGGTVRRLYVSGDTLLVDDLEDIPRRFPALDVGLSHLGGTTGLGLMVTMDAEQGARAVELVAPRTALPVHDDDDVFTSGLAEFVGAARARGLQDRIHPWERGGTYLL